jgi:hypothetical protein
MAPRSDTLARLRSRLQRKLSARRVLTELAACPAPEQRRIAADIGFGLSDLRRLAGSHLGPPNCCRGGCNSSGLIRSF